MSEENTDFEKAKELQKSNYGPNPPTFYNGFDAGSRWAHEWVSDKGIGHLTDWMKGVNKKREQKLHDQWRAKWEQALDSRDSLLKEIDDLQAELKAIAGR